MAFLTGEKLNNKQLTQFEGIKLEISDEPLTVGIATDPDRKPFVYQTDERGQLDWVKKHDTFAEAVTDARRMYGALLDMYFPKKVAAIVYPDFEPAFVGGFVAAVPKPAAVARQKKVKPSGVMLNAAGCGKAKSPDIYRVLKVTANKQNLPVFRETGEIELRVNPGKAAFIRGAEKLGKPGLGKQPRQQKLKIK